LRNPEIDNKVFVTGEVVAWSRNQMSKSLCRSHDVKRIGVQAYRKTQKRQEVGLIRNGTF